MACHDPTRHCAHQRVAMLYGRLDTRSAPVAKRLDHLAGQRRVFPPGYPGAAEPDCPAHKSFLEQRCIPLSISTATTLPARPAVPPSAIRCPAQPPGSSGRHRPPPAQQLTGRFWLFRKFCPNRFCGASPKASQQLSNFLQSLHCAFCDKMPINTRQDRDSGSEIRVSGRNSESFLLFPPEPNPRNPSSADFSCVRNENAQLCS